MVVTAWLRHDQIVVHLHSSPRSLAGAFVCPQSSEDAGRRTKASTACPAAPVSVHDGHINQIEIRHHLPHLAYSNP